MDSHRVDRLLSLPLGELRERFVTRNRPVPQGLVEALKQDGRRGAQVLAEAIEKVRRENRSEGQRLRHLLVHERELWDSGFQALAGVDEAGVAPLAGPVIAAAVILPRDFKARGIDDSKKLDAEAREALRGEILANAVCWAVGIAEVEEIDRLNIYQANLLALRRAVLGLSTAPDHLLVDGPSWRRVPEVPMPQRGIVKGDALSLTIAAASIVAKTTRDRLMAELAAKYPGYGFERHKGYPTEEHFATLEQLGPCDIHRRSFAPVRKALGLEPLQVELPFAGADEALAGEDSGD